MAKREIDPTEDRPALRGGCCARGARPLRVYVNGVTYNGDRLDTAKGVRILGGDERDIRLDPNPPVRVEAP